MKTQKTIAIIMMLASSVLTAWVSGDIAYPAILCMLGLLGLQRRFTWNIRPEKRVITSLLLLLLAIMFSLHYRYATLTGHLAHEQPAAVAWQTITRYFLASMILILFFGSPKRLPFSLGLFHIAITISAGQVLLLDDRYIAYRLSELLSVILVVLYAAASHGSMDTLTLERMGHTSRRFAFGLILIVAANCGWITSSILYRHVEVLNYLPVLFWRGGVSLGNIADDGTHVGFSTSGKLSSLLLIKEDQDPTPVLTITCDDSPGYLRARAFEVYRQSEWHDLSHKEAFFPEQNTFSTYFVRRTNVFRLDQSDTSNCKYMSIRHELLTADAVFTPLGTSFLETSHNLLLWDDDDIIYAPNSHGGLNYRIAYTQSAYQKPPTNEQAHRMLNVPIHLDPRLQQLANRIFRGCRTTMEKIDAVVNYFHNNYTYSLGLDIPPDRDKLTHFLLEETSGYCEYFASGAAILLRLAGVPTRYVTGFLITEKDNLSGSWVARNMDAHAWTEAWDQEQNQWAIVEATGQENLATLSTAEQLGRMGGGPGTLLGQLLQALYQYGLFGVFGWLVKSYSLLVVLLLLTILLGCALLLVLIYYKRKESKSETQLRALRNPGLVTLQKMLVKMDSKVKAAGFWRHLSETLHTFSRRLRSQDSGDGRWTSISDWYLEYADLRYCRTISSKRLQHLQQLAQELKDSLAIRRRA